MRPSLLQVRSFLLLVVLLLGFSFTAQAADVAKGKTVYATYCSACHGPEGAGDGPTAAALPESMKPASFESGAFKKVKTDEDMLKLLKEGGPAFGLSPVMAAQAALSDDDMTNVIAFVRSLKK